MGCRTRDQDISGSAEQDIKTFLQTFRLYEICLK